MNPHGLLASAAINIGLAFITLSLFSILKKQPSNASIYYAHRLSHRLYVPFDSPPYSLNRFLPSISWISRAFSVTEDEIIEAHGLDALVIIRLFKFGRRIRIGATVQWIVIRYLMLVEVLEGFGCILPSCVLYLSMGCSYCIRIQQLQNLKHRPDQFTIIVREIPLCIEHKSHDCCVDHFFSKHYPNTYYSYQMVYGTEDLEVLVAKSLQRKIEDLRETPMAKKRKNKLSLLALSQQETSKVALLEEKLQALCHKIHQLQCKDMLKKKELPVAFVTFKSRSGAAIAAQLQQHSHPLLWITELAPEPRDVSWRNMRVSYRVVPLYKLGVLIAASLLTVFFAIPVTAVQGIAKYEKLKKWFPPAMAVQLIPGLSSIVTGYLPSVVLKGFIYVVPFAMFAMAKVAGCIARRSLLDVIGQFVSQPKNIPSHLAKAVSAQADFFLTYILTDGLSGFSLEVLQPVVAPLLLPFLIVYFCLGYVVYINQIQDVYETTYETGGHYWPYIHHYILLAIILMQITMIGLFGLKSKPAASISTIPLLLFTLMFNEYCKMRFLPSFHHHSLKDAAENDELDEKFGLLEFHCENAINAYCPPGLRPVNFMQSECSSTPLVSS
ncbi:Calcium-dependent channel, 7TM region, putative phosphate [Sesbania bispinosa]|nr:Calcium-dependent channel, 7TM region, putative phosphate [Sesbania bispinosa]